MALWRYGVMALWRYGVMALSYPAKSAGNFLFLDFLGI
jgi:hypothetical protein